jgi:hypothetical protein
MHPAAVHAAFTTKFSRPRMLLAWDRNAEVPRLAGAWALHEHDHGALWPSFLAAPPYNYAFLSNPVVEPEHAEAVIAAFLDAIARERSLPKVLRLKYLDGDSETYAALVKALAARGSHAVRLSTRARAFATKDATQKKSGSTRKKLRQDWNRLSAIGTVEVVNDRSCDGARDAFETFLAMEAASWKGERGTALLSHAKDAAFAHRLIANLAARGCASVAQLQVDGQPIAAQVLLYCGNTAYTWKTAFDARFAKYSPGALLVDKVTEALFQTPGIEAIDSCSPDGSFMEQMWPGRRTTVDLLTDVRARPSIGFTVAAIGERGYVQLRDLRNRIRDAKAPARPKPAKTPAA